jgi:mannosyl-3-phosphoglycerate phosphatase
VALFTVASERVCLEKGKMKPRLPIVLFSDVDDVLLDRALTYGFGEATRALDVIAQEDIPLVFCSGKTRAELELVYQELDISHPFICEDGSAVFVPYGYFGFDIPNARDVAGYQAIEFGRPYPEVVDALRRTAERLSIGIMGFSDMSVEQVAGDCELPLMQARLAKLREYEEPFRITDGGGGARNRLVRALRAARLGCTNRGVYDYAGAPVDKGASVELLCDLFRRRCDSVLTVGVGDNVGGISVLRRVDVPLVVTGDGTDAMPRWLTDVPEARFTTGSGEAGWADAILGIVEAVRRHSTRSTGT